MISRRRLTACLAVTALLALAGCGGSGASHVSPRTYVTAVCNVFTHFKSAAAATYGSLAGTTRSSDPAVVRPRLVAALSGLQGDVHQAVVSLNRAGVPDVTGGAGLAHTLVTRFRALDGALVTAVSRAKVLPTGDKATFARQLITLGAAVTQAGQDVGAGLPTNAPGLDRIAAGDPACKGV